MMLGNKEEAKAFAGQYASLHDHFFVIRPFIILR
jgi:hypothetical protein